MNPDDQKAKTGTSISEIQEQQFIDFKKIAKKGLANHFAEIGFGELQGSVLHIFWLAIIIGIVGNIVATLTYDLFLHDANMETKGELLLILVIFIVTPIIWLFSPARKYIQRGVAKKILTDRDIVLDKFLEENIRAPFMKAIADNKTLQKAPVKSESKTEIKD